MGFNDVFFGLYLGHNVDFFEYTSDSNVKKMNLVDYLKLIAKKVYVNTAGRRDTILGRPMDRTLEGTFESTYLESPDFAKIQTFLPQQNDEIMDEMFDNLVLEVHLQDDFVTTDGQSLFIVSLGELEEMNLEFKLRESELKLGSYGCCVFGIGWICGNWKEEVEITELELEELTLIYAKLKEEKRLPEWASIKMKANCCS